MLDLGFGSPVIIKQLTGDMRSTNPFVVYCAMITICVSSLFSMFTKSYVYQPVPAQQGRNRLYKTHLQSLGLAKAWMNNTLRLVNFHGFMPICETAARCSQIRLEVCLRVFSHVDMI